MASRIHPKDSFDVLPFRRGAAALGVSLVALIASCVAASAQAAAGVSHDLPAVTVAAPKERPKPAPVRARPAARVERVRKVAATPRKRPEAIAVQRPATARPTAARAIDPQSPTGPGTGFSATRTETATKTDTPILVTPQSISVTTKDQIRDTGAQTLSEAIGYSAGVQTAPFGYDSRYDQFLIRGFTTNTIGVYKDGLREANGTFAFFENEPYDLDRIEILRGPSSVLYGSGNPGGIVNLVSKAPQEATFGEIGADFGSYDRKQARFDINTPIGTGGNVWFRVDGLLRDGSTQVPGSPNDRANVSPSLKIDIDSRTTLTLLGNYAGNRNSMWPYYIHTATDQVLPLRAGDPGFDTLNQDQYSFGYKFEHAFDDHVLVRQNFRIGGVGFNGDFVDAATTLAPGQTVIPRYAGLVSESTTSAALDNNVQVKLKTGPVAHTALLGLDYYEQSATFLQNLGFNIPGFGNNGGFAPSLNINNPVYYAGPFLLGQTPNASTHQTLDQLGVYAQEQAEWGGLHINLGGREDHASLRTDNLLASTSTPSDADHFSGRAGALYLFDNGIAPYVSYSTSFLPITGTTASGTAFKPTTGEQVEGGFKYAPVGWHSTFTASYFNIYQDNVQTSDPVNPGFSIQTGQERSRGVELEAVIGLAPGLNGIASYSNTDIVNTVSTTAFGKIPVGVPRNLASFFLDYTIQAGQLKGLGGGVGTRYIGSTYADAANTLRNGAITSVDLQGHYDTGRLRFQVSARNIADQRVAICNSGNCTFSEARMILGSVTARW